MTGWMAARPADVAAGRHAANRVARTVLPMAVSVALLCMACSAGSSTDGSPTSARSAPSITSPTAVSPTSTTASSSTSSSPSSGAEREAADRAAVEQAWTAYWQMHQGLLAKPAAGWPAAVGAVAVDPTRQQVLDEAKTFTSSGMGFYGQVVNHPYWSNAIDGKDLALMGDCMDTSQYGTLVVKTGVKRTVGISKNNTTVTFAKGSDGRWRVQKIEYLLGTPC